MNDMSTSYLDGPAVHAAAAPVAAASRWRILIDAASSVLGAAVYIAAVVYVLSASTARVYGFSVSRDFRTLIEIALQVCPMLAGFVLLFLLPVKERLVNSLTGRIHRTAAMLALSAAAAAGAVMATVAAISFVGGYRTSPVSAVTLLWVAGEFAFDVMLIGVFTSTLYALKRRLLVTIPLFLAYVAIVMVAGNRWGIPSYIGFASSVPVMLTTYSTAPLFDRAAWAFRAYWTCASMLMVAILHAFDCPPRSLAGAIRERFRGKNRPWRAVFPIAAACGITILAAGAIWKLQHHAVVRRQAPSQSALAAAIRGEEGAGRLHLAQYSVTLQYSPAEETVDVKGVLTFRNSDRPIHSAFFQLPGLMVPGQFSIAGAGPAQIWPLGKYTQAKFAAPVKPMAEIRVSYRGTIRSAGPFDLSAQGKVLDSAFFLTDADILPEARRPACLESSEQQASRAMASECGLTENYLMSDRATGSITVIAPQKFRVISPGVESIRPLRGGEAEHVFTVATPQLATFLVAAARFRETTATSASHSATIHVFRAGAGVDGDIEAPVARDILAFYESVWTPYGKHDLNIVEIPTPLGEAMAFEGTVAISDKIISSRSPISGNASDFLVFVMAHEIAHQWWGFQVVPARSPGRLFVIESLPQFAAYAYLNKRGILSPEAALHNEERRYRSARARLGTHEVSLAQSVVVDEVAYNKGPFALLTLDRIGGRSLMNRLAGVIESYSAGSREGTRPDQVMTAVIGELPPAAQELAAELLYRTGLPSDRAQR
jgi:ABC-2 type transport system permease protein